MTAMIKVEIAYGRSDQQVLLALEVPATSTVAQAIAIAGILSRFPEINLTTAKVGIFSKITPLDSPLSAGDRIEIYRPLKIDPKTARRLRAAKAKKISKNKS